MILLLKGRVTMRFIGVVGVVLFTAILVWVWVGSPEYNLTNSLICAMGGIISVSMILGGINAINK